VLVEQAAAVAPERLGAFAGRLNPQELAAVDDSSSDGARAVLSADAAYLSANPLGGAR